MPAEGEGVEGVEDGGGFGVDLVVGEEEVESGGVSGVGCLEEFVWDGIVRGECEVVDVVAEFGWEVEEAGVVFVDARGLWFCDSVAGWSSLWGCVLAARIVRFGS